MVRKNGGFLNRANKKRRKRREGEEDEDGLLKFFRAHFLSYRFRLTQKRASQQVGDASGDFASICRGSKHLYIFFPPLFSSAAVYGKRREAGGIRNRSEIYTAGRRGSFFLCESPQQSPHHHQNIREVLFHNSAGCAE